MSHQPKHIYEFDPYRLDPAERLLLRDGEVVPLQPKVFDLLLVLVEHQGHLVEKDELMKLVWPDAVVEEANLANNVSILRKTLSENGERLIETVPKRGYRFVAGVRAVTDEVERLSIQSNDAGLAANGMNESIGTAAAALDRAAAPDGEVDGEVDRGMKRPRLLTPPLMLTLTVSVILLVAVGGLVGWYLRRESTPPVWRPVPLTSDPGFEHNPALSPDGKQVAFTWNGVKQDNFDIYVKLVGSNTPLQLTKNPAEDISPAWSPNGDSIAFLRRQGGDRNELMLIPALGGAERKLTETVIVDFRHNSRLLSLAWSPDGRWIAVSHRESGDLGEGLFLVSAQTGQKRRLTRLPAGSAGDFMPAFSPNGRTLLFARFSGYSSVKAHLLSLSEDFEPVGEARPLKTDERYVSSPVWTPDGRYVLYLAAPNIGQREQTELRKIAVSGSGLSERVSLLEGAISEVSLGRHLVYARSAADTDIWRAEITPAGGKARELRRLIYSTRMDNRPRYSPDGKKIYFTSTRSGAEAAWIADADGSNPVQLTTFGGPLVGWSGWSPDSQRLVFSARPEGQSDIFTIPATGGVPKRLTTDPSDDVGPSYSRDGRWIYFGSARSGQIEIWKMPAEGGDAIKITSTGGRAAFESFDGKTLYFIPLNLRKGIWKIPVQGGEATQVVTEPVNYIAYAVGAEGIFYAAAPDNSQQGLIRFFNFSSGQSRTVVVTDRPIDFHPMSLSPDQRFLVFAQHDQTSSDLMLIENFVVR